MKYYLIDYDNLSKTSSFLENVKAALGNNASFDGEVSIYASADVSKANQLGAFFENYPCVKGQLVQTYNSTTIGCILRKAKALLRGQVPLNDIHIVAEESVKAYLNETLLKENRKLVQKKPEIKAVSDSLDAMLTESLSEMPSTAKKTENTNRSNNNNNNNNNQPQKNIDSLIQAGTSLFTSFVASLEENEPVKNFISGKINDFFDEANVVLTETQQRENANISKNKNKQNLNSPTGARIAQLGEKAFMSALKEPVLVDFITKEANKIKETGIIEPLETMFNQVNISPEKLQGFAKMSEESAHFQDKVLLTAQLDDANWFRNKTRIEVIVDLLNQPEALLSEICPNNTLATLNANRAILVQSVIGQTAPKNKTEAGYNQSAAKLKCFVESDKTILMNIIGKEGIDQINEKIRQRLRLAQVQAYIHPQIAESNNLSNNSSSATLLAYSDFLRRQLNNLAQIIDDKVELFGNHKDSGARQKNSQDMLDEFYALDKLYNAVDKLQLSSNYDLAGQINAVIFTLAEGKDEHYAKGMKKHGSGFGLSKAEQFCKDIVKQATSLDAQITKQQNSTLHY